MSNQVQEQISVEAEEQVEFPKNYKVLFHNDNKTTMEFVIMVLMQIFHKSAVDAQNVMYKVHQEGIGLAGVYPFEIAEQKTDETLRIARQYSFPLAVTYEEAE